MDANTTICFFCGSDSGARCVDCSWAFVCPQHEHLHRDPHGQCFPYRVERVEGVGNCLVAARDIAPGEMVLRDPAASVAPSTPSLVCLECLAPVSATTRCSSCNLPLCCSGPHHQLECGLMSAKLEGNPNSGQLGSSLYLTVSVIRLLSLKNSDPDKWKLVRNLMDHLEERRKQPKWDKIVQGVKDSIGEEDAEDVEAVVGILLTNSVSCRPVLGVERGQALFPVFSLTSHSCTANTWRCIEDDILTLRATVAVPRGTELTTSYKSPSIGSVSRRAHFPATWFFSCRCARCSSSTELGTYMSALRCPSCPGFLLPTHPLDEASSWACSQCSNTMEGKDALATTVMLHKAAEEAKGSVERLEKMASHMENVLHKNHYLLLQVKRDLAMVYGNADGFELRDLSSERLKKKMSFCRDNLAVMEVVEPGFSRWRGRMLEQLANAKLEDITRRVEEGSLGKMEVMDEYKEAVKLIKMAGKCAYFDTKEEQKMFADRVKMYL